MEKKTKPKKVKAKTTTATLSEKEKTKEELKQLGKDATLLVDGTIDTVKGIGKILLGLLKMLVFAVKFSIEGWTSLADKKKKK